MGRVDDDGVLGLVVDHEVSVVVALPHPFGKYVSSRSRSIHINCFSSQQNIHIGIDWICILRAAVGYEED